MSIVSNVRVRIARARQRVSRPAQTDIVLDRLDALSRAVDDLRHDVDQAMDMLRSALVDELRARHNDAWQAQEIRHEHVLDLLTGIGADLDTNAVQRHNDASAAQFRHEHLLTLTDPGWVERQELLRQVAADVAAGSDLPT